MTIIGMNHRQKLFERWTEFLGSQTEDSPKFVRPEDLSGHPIKLPTTQFCELLRFSKLRFFGFEGPLDQLVLCDIFNCSDIAGALPVACEDRRCSNTPPANGLV